MNTQKQIVLIVALMFLFVGGCAAYSAIELPVRAPDQADWTRDQSLERGALLFANNCRTCHGNKGEGGVGPQLLNATSQFQDQDPLKLAANRTLIRRTLTCGRAGTLMPAWLSSNGGSLNAIQIEHLVDFLTSPIEISDDGEATSHWWEEATHFAANLNGQISVVVGGDTLGSIAKSHNVGAKELADFNKLPLEGKIKKGTEIRIPAFNNSKAYTYTVYKDNETFEKIADSQFIGARILADLNDLPYKFSEKRGVATMHLQTPEGREVAGLFPGSTLRLPGGGTYTIAAGDTLEALATRHGVSTSAIKSLNQGILGSLDDTDDIPFERQLKLPKQVAVVQAGQTLAIIASLHDVEIADLAAANALAADAVVAAGTELKLPSGAVYVVQPGDTWALAATLHGTTAEALATANGAAVSDPLSPSVIIKMPDVNAYVVQGESLEKVAGHYGNVSADSLAAKNNIPSPTAIIAVGTTLHLPDDAYGSAPGDAKNPGTACVQYAVSSSVFKFIETGEAAGAEPNPPAAVSKVVTILATQAVPEFDWIVDADGVKSESNKGVVKVAAGTDVTFENVIGLHSITLNGTANKPDISKPGEKRVITFKDPGKFKITCDYHPAMLAWLFVE